MIAFLCKNLSFLITKHSSSFSKSHVPYTVSLRSLSILKERQDATIRELYDVLVHKHSFSPEVASLVASNLTKFRSPDKADLILSFLNDCGFSRTQLEKIVMYKPRILSRSVEDIKFKIKILHDLGLSSGEITKIIFTNQMILHLSAKTNIIPTLSLLKGLLGSDCNVARLLRKSGWFILADLERTLLPNVELLKSCGMPMERILQLLYLRPRCLLTKPDTIRKSVDKAKEMGFSESSNMFIYAVQAIIPISQGMWEVKMQGFRDLGFSDSDTLAMFKRAPGVFSVSLKKIEKIKELLLATGKFNMSTIVRNPASLTCSLEKRYKPRLRVLGILERRNLIKKWPGLVMVYTLSDDKFFERYIRPYMDEVGEAFDAKGDVKANGEEG